MIKLKNLIPIFLFAAFIGCNEKEKNPVKNAVKKIYHRKAIDTIHIVRLGKVQDKYVEAAKNAVMEHFGVPVIIQPMIGFMPNMKGPSRTRYSGDSIIHHLKNNRHQLIITTTDIVTWKKEKKMEYGIFGIGYQPGKICVVAISPFRMAKNVPEKKLMDRIRKVSIHEIGHNLGLPHCTYDNTCVMNDAKGKGNTVDKENEAFCPHCKEFIASKL